jgi:LAO/AO transport system kinase
MSSLVDGVRAGSRRSLAKLLTIIENEREGAREALAALFPHTGRAWILGVTGAPGTGKSSLVNALAKAYRARGQTVAIIAVDPTSPFTGGAILGDRIRMRDLAGDPGVFIRSMATRGSLGGLARATREVIRVLDAAGFDRIVVETVGAGQSEVEIVRAAHTTVVVEAPGLGDDVQAIKAGILEIADVLVVNKADRPGAQNTIRALKAMLELGHPTRTARVNHHGQRMQVDTPVAEADSIWLPPVIQTVATAESAEESGVAALIDAIDAHRDHLHTAGTLEPQERERIMIELRDRLQHELMTRLLGSLPDGLLTETVRRVQARELDPRQAVAWILDAS